MAKCVNLLFYGFYAIFKKTFLPGVIFLYFCLILFLSYISVFIQMEFIFLWMRFLNVFSFQMISNYTIYQSAFCLYQFEMAHVTELNSHMNTNLFPGAPFFSTDMFLLQEPAVVLYHTSPCSFAWLSLGILSCIWFWNQLMIWNQLWKKPA